ncbi:isochorismatase family protein [Paenibacillus taichungensis]|uniref:isochorismatase family protein n=1 Tax=Paenibacillus taichungensis TaxID=484184 RepID=UPI002DB95989|nr:isochorismatase family protein [Paenibacillus taichungensis]MEC0109605.1 isochorismatase family protein [Paenibacillus taichungensis]MEC0197357.1 isochorismatase family protein [Paenibacillus taichungensis]
MALPKIQPYAMPVESELPVNKVTWTPDTKRSVLLIHDMQQYFMNAFTAGQSPVVELIDHISQLRSKCHELGIPVVYSAQPGGQTPEQRGLQLDFWGAGIDGGPVQKEIIDALAPAPQDTFMTKWRYSAFQKTDLFELMQRDGRDQLIVCGIYAHIGCLMTSCEAFMRDIQAFLVADAVADFSAEKHRMALTYAAERCAVTLTTGRLLESLNDSGADGNEGALKSEVGEQGERSYAASAQVAVSEAEQQTASAAEPIQDGSHGIEQVTLEALRNQVGEMLQEQPGNIGEHDDLIQMWGLDSIRIMSLAERFRVEGAGVTFVDLAELPTLAAWAALLDKAKNKVLPNGDYF